jgi:hypothetical protein
MHERYAKNRERGEIKKDEKSKRYEREDMNIGVSRTFAFKNSPISQILLFLSKIDLALKRKNWHYSVILFCL